jgi:hypothetical protein
MLKCHARTHMFDNLSVCTPGDFMAALSSQNEQDCLGLTRDIQRLPTTPFSLVLRKEYSSERLSRSTLNIKEGGRGESVLLYSLVLQL